MTPAALSLVTIIFPEGDERNVALGIRGATTGAGALLLATGAACGVLVHATIAERVRARPFRCEKVPLS